MSKVPAGLEEGALCLRAMTNQLPDCQTSDMDDNGGEVPRESKMDSTKTGTSVRKKKITSYKAKHELQQVA